MSDPPPDPADAFRSQLPDAAPGPAVAAVDAGAPPVIVMVDRAGTVLDVAPTGPALLGTDDLVGRDLHDFVVADERRALTTVIAHALGDDGTSDRAFEVLLTGRRADALPLVMRVSAPGGMATSAAAVVLERWGGPLQWSGGPTIAPPPRSGPDHLLSHDARGAMRNARNFAGIFVRKVGVAGPDSGPPLDANGHPVTFDLLETAVRSVANADEMLERIVWFIRLEHAPMAMQRVALGRLVEAARQEAERTGNELAEAHDAPALAGPTVVHLHGDGSGDVGRAEVVGEPELLTWGLAELIVNARKFAGPDTQVTFTARVVDDLVELMVRSSGVAIDPELAEEAFRLGRLLQPRGERPGVGMGLPLLRRIVTRHGGRVRFDVPTMPGADTDERRADGAEGTTIRLRLPGMPSEIVR